MSGLSLLFWIIPIVVLLMGVVVATYALARRYRRGGSTLLELGSISDISALIVEHGRKGQNHWRSFAKFAVLQSLYFIVAVTNIRALAHLQYGWAVLTDGLFCILTWTIVKNIGEAKDPYSRIGYVIGGMVGSLIGMWITNMWGN
jgi:hypothetical protein